MAQANGRSDNYVLNDLNPRQDDDVMPVEGHALPPADRGLQAWLLLAGCFVINVLIWGFAFSFGVFLEYYSSHEPFASNPHGIPAIGTTATGLMYLLMPIYFSVLQRWPVLKRISIWASIPVVAAALIGASFAQSVPHLIVCQGAIFAVGGNMMFAPTVTYLDEWFVRKKGMAIGIMWAGDGAGGAIMPLVIQALLSRYGFRITLRAITCAIVTLIIPLLTFIKPRLPIPPASTVRPVDTSFLKSPLFWTLQSFNVVQGMGYFLPPNYLPTYANSLGLSSQFGSITLVVVNLASVAGCVLVGLLMDRSDVTNVVLAISVSAAIATWVVWGVATSIAPLCIFALLYGLTAGAYSTSWTGMIREVRTRHVAADPNVVFGFLAAGRGLGSVLSGPLSEALVAASQSQNGLVGSSYGSRYSLLIIFSGCTSLVGGFSWIARKINVI